MSKIDKIKEKYEILIKNGGSVKDISKNSENEIGQEIYKLANWSKIYDDMGNRMKVAEVFKEAGIPYVGRKELKENHINAIKQELEEYVKRHGDINLIKKSDIEYKHVQNLFMQDEFGNDLSLEEKFAVLGFERNRQRSRSSKNDLIEQISNYLKNGGDIYLAKSQLPFYEKYATYSRNRRRSGVYSELSFQENLRELGFDYSEMYYRFQDVVKLKDFADENGFVDNYRKNKQMRNSIKEMSYSLGLPIPVFVGLVGNAKLKGCFLDTDYHQFVKEKLNNYLIGHDNFFGISRKAAEIYYKTIHIKNESYCPGAIMSNDNVMNLLEFDDIANNFERDYKDNGMADLIDRIKPIAMAQGGKLSRKDMSNADYKKVLKLAASFGTTTKGFMHFCGIDYDGRDSVRLAKVWVKKYPYMQEMRAERDRILAENGVDFSSKKEDLFDVLIYASVSAFEKYKKDIFLFDTSILETDTYKKYKGSEFCSKYKGQINKAPSKDKGK